MISTISLPATCLAIALSAISLTGCGHDRALQAAGGAERARVDQTGTAQAIAEADAALADLRAQAREAIVPPKECGWAEKSGVTAGDRLDAALIKTDRALDRANRRAGACYDGQKRRAEAFAGGEE